MKPITTRSLGALYCAALFFCLFAVAAQAELTVPLGDNAQMGSANSASAKQAQQVQQKAQQQGGAVGSTGGLSSKNLNFTSSNTVKGINAANGAQVNVGGLDLGGSTSSSTATSAGGNIGGGTTPPTSGSSSTPSGTPTIAVGPPTPTSSDDSIRPWNQIPNSDSAIQLLKFDPLNGFDEVTKNNALINYNGISYYSSPGSTGDVSFNIGWQVDKSITLSGGKFDPIAALTAEIGGNIGSPPENGVAAEAAAMSMINNYLAGGNKFFNLTIELQSFEDNNRIVMNLEYANGSGPFSVVIDKDNHIQLLYAYSDDSNTNLSNYLMANNSDLQAAIKLMLEANGFLF